MDTIIFTDCNGVPGFGRYAGAYKVATEIRNTGYSCQVIDFFAHFTLEESKQLIDKFITKDTLIVGFATTLFSRATEDEASPDLRKRLRLSNIATFPHSNPWMMEFLNYIKTKNSNCKIVIGGAKAPHYNGRLPVDYYVLGEADNSIIALLNCLKNNKKIENKIYSNTNYRYDKFKTSKILFHVSDHIFDNEHLPIEIARGCAFNCKFCNYDKKNTGDNVKLAETIKEEMLLNYSNWGTTGYMFTDDLYNDSIHKVRSLHETFTSLPFQIEWSSYARLDLMWRWREMRELLQESGARSLQFGIETFNHKAGKHVGKGLHPDKQKELLYFLKEKYKNDVLLGASFIIGLPGETEESLNETFDWLTAPDCPLDSFVFQKLYIPKCDKTLEDIIDYSTFSKETNETWLSKEITSEQADELLTNFTTNEKCKTKTYLSSFQFYSRMRNLGYDYTKCFNISKTSDINFKEFKIRKENLKQRYLKQIYEN